MSNSRRKRSLREVLDRAAKTSLKELLEDPIHSDADSVDMGEESIVNKRLKAQYKISPRVVVGSYLRPPFYYCMGRH